MREISAACSSGFCMSQNKRTKAYVQMNGCKNLPDSGAEMPFPTPPPPNSFALTSILSPGERRMTASGEGNPNLPFAHSLYFALTAALRACVFESPAAVCIATCVTAPRGEKLSCARERKSNVFGRPITLSRILRSPSPWGEEDASAPGEGIVAAKQSGGSEMATPITEGV
jgi:hypothetical protein